MPAFQDSPTAPRHQYPVGLIELTVELVLSAAVSQRAAAAVLQRMSCLVPGLKRLPCANSGRLWMLRLGLYELTRDKPPADDWLWIMDHTVQLGPWKCLVIVGIRLSCWDRTRPLEHKDLTLLNLTPMKHSTGEAVAEQLRRTGEQVGIPRAVLSDEGAELISGTKLFRQEVSAARDVSHVHDIKHKVATLLKRELHTTKAWKAFVKQAQRTQLAVGLTELAFLKPPSLKTKARYMNLDTLVNWGGRVLEYLDHPRDLPGATLDRQKLAQKLGWLRKYRARLAVWQNLLEVGRAAETYVRGAGYHTHAMQELDQLLTPLAKCPASLRLKAGLLEFMDEQSRDLPPGRHLIGSSEVLESLLGKYKRLQNTHSKGGMTAALLNIGATLLHKTPTVIQRALEAVPVQKVHEWLRDKLGVTIQAQQALALRKHKTNPQIQPATPATF